MSTTFGPVIHVTSRADLITSGDLVDVSPTAREAGFRHPVALTRAAWQDAVAWSEENDAPQDVSGRLWDVLAMAHHAARSSRGPRAVFTVCRVPNAPSAIDPEMTTLHLHVGPGDTAAPVLTILTPHED
ncbi:DUF6573 family protein [Isoptericola rhizosphaerae]|uniref:DUF6573 family protein n=1 Tax=Isoptericola rhizosphaerae TaxID=3377837 RepID=UPI00383B4DFE